MSTHSNNNPEPWTPAPLPNTNPDIIREFVMFAQDNNLIKRLPLELRKSLVANGIISYKDLCAHIVADISRLTCQAAHHPYRPRSRGWPASNERKWGERMSQNFRPIIHDIHTFVEEFQQDAAAMEIALSLVVDFCKIFQIHEEQWYKCELCSFWNRVDDVLLPSAQQCLYLLSKSLVQIVSRHCYTFLRKVKVELLQPSPQWDPRWFAFVDNIFVPARSMGSNVTWSDGPFSVVPGDEPYAVCENHHADSYSYSPREKSFIVVSHVYAYIQELWFMEASTGRLDILPLEIRRMIFSYHESKGLPPPGFEWPDDNIFCDTCLSRCEFMTRLSSWEPNRDDWTFQRVHVITDEHQANLHDPGCHCQKKGLVRNPQTVTWSALLDPANMMARIREKFDKINAEWDKVKITVEKRDIRKALKTTSEMSESKELGKEDDEEHVDEEEEVEVNREQIEIGTAGETEIGERVSERAVRGRAGRNLAQIYDAKGGKTSHWVRRGGRLNRKS